MVKKIRNIFADSKLKTGSFLDLTVEEDSILTPISTNTVRYYGRDGLSDVFDILADNQETEQRYNLALVGPPGVGKSNLVWAVADHLAGKKGKSALWVSHRVFGEKWTVRRFIPDKGVFGITGCPLLLSDILELDVANVDVLILDAPTNADDNTSIDGIAAFEWATTDCTRNEYQRVIHVWSLGAFTNKSTIADNFHVREIRMRTWTRQDFVEAVVDKIWEIEYAVHSKSRTHRKRRRRRWWTPSSISLGSTPCGFSIFRYDASRRNAGQLLRDWYIEGSHANLP